MAPPAKPATLPSWDRGKVDLDDSRNWREAKPGIIDLRSSLADLGQISSTIIAT